jgi:chromosome segregation ATPase
MLVSLSSYCQYPTVKTIGKDTVVIMTVKQGEDINNQFTVLKDSLSTLNELTLTLRKQMASMGARNIQLSKNLSKSMDEVGIVNKKVDIYRGKYEEAENTIRFLKRDHKNVVVGVLSLLAAWTVYTSIMLNK